jgi:hypothetical protein
MLDQILPPPVVKARGKPIHHSDRSIRRPQQQRSRSRRHQTPVKSCFHKAAFNHSKIKAFCATLRRHRGAPRVNRKSLQHSNFR